MIKTNIKQAVFMAGLLIAVIVSQVWLVRHGSPEAVWLYCDMLEWC